MSRHGILRDRRDRSPAGVARAVPPHLYFVVSALFHYLGPVVRGAAVRARARCSAWRGCESRAPPRSSRCGAGPGGPRRRRSARRAGCCSPGAPCSRVMNCCFYEAIDRLPLATVAAIEFLPVIALAAIGARTRRNTVALLAAVPGVYLLTGVRDRGAAVRAWRSRSPTRPCSPPTSCSRTGSPSIRASTASTDSPRRC